MTVGEVLKRLVTAENYVQVRVTVSDQFIEMVKDMLPDDYEYIEEKERHYQEFVELINRIESESH